MSGMIGILGNNYDDIDQTFLVETIDPLSLCETNITHSGDAFLAVSSNKNAPLQGDRHYKDADYIACFCGDLINTETVPWNSIINAFHNKDYEYLADYEGTFTIAIFDKKQEVLFIVSDKRSQQPIFYYIADNRIVFSTAVSTFLRLPEVPEFEEKWLYEFLFFNFPIAQTTFLRNVQRMPPASILKYELCTAQSSLFEYSGQFKRKENLIQGDEAIEYAWTTFKERVPPYFGDTDEITCSLTGGLDTRLLLSLAPPRIRELMKTYTYGVPGSPDVIIASQIANSLKLPHTIIPFDNAFLDILPRLIHETVYLSNGLQNVNRSALLYAYRTLTDNGRHHPINISGISGGQLFRGHVNVPNIVSPEMDYILRTGKKDINQEFYKKVVKRDHFNAFAHHISSTLDKIEGLYGNLSQPDSHLSYLIYEVATKYFGGEASIANLFSTFRVPFWDAEIIQLAYEIEYSTITLSQFLPAKEDHQRTNRLKVRLLQKNPEFAKFSYHGTRLEFFTEKSKIQFYAHKAMKYGRRMIRSRFKPVRYPSPEQWGIWYKTALDLKVETLVSKDSLLLNYLNLEFLEQMRRENNKYWLGKIVTAEIILNLTRNRWRL